MDTKTCLQCGTELRGRIDKKFCDDQCNQFHALLQSQQQLILLQANNLSSG
jgi:hypothetical protein